MYVCMDVFLRTVYMQYLEEIKFSLKEGFSMKFLLTIASCMGRLRGSICVFVHMCVHTGAVLMSVCSSSCCAVTVLFE